VSGTAAIQVTQTVPPPPTVARIVVSPANPTVNVGNTVQLSATAYDASGNQLGGLTFTWSSSDTTHARVSSVGLVTGVAAGSAVIGAATGSVTGTAPIQVTSVAPPPPSGCANPQAGWIWCDDFEQDRTSSYFEYIPENGSFTRTARPACARAGPRGR
jgi:hypothetical protein